MYIYELFFCLSNTSLNGFETDMTLLPYNLHTQNGRKVITANLQCLEKSYETFYHVVFLEVCKSYGITPIGFNIKNTSCVGKPSKKFLLLWGKKFAASQFKLIELTIIEFAQKLSDLKTE